MKIVISGHGELVIDYRKWCEAGLPKRVRHWIGVEPTDKQRTDPRLVALVEREGCRASAVERSGNTLWSHPEVVEIPDGVEWEINRDDETGDEWVAEKHRCWYAKHSGSKWGESCPEEPWLREKSKGGPQ